MRRQPLVPLILSVLVLIPGASTIKATSMPAHEEFPTAGRDGAETLPAALPGAVGAPVPTGDAWIPAAATIPEPGEPADSPDGHDLISSDSHSGGRRTETDEPPAPADLAQAREALQSAPLMFIENVGQFDERALFQARGGGGALWLAENALWITVVEPGGEGAEEPGTELRPLRASAPQPRKGVNLKLSFVGAEPSARLEPFNRVETSVNYFLGDDPEEWRSNVPVWGGVRYVDIYPGMDLEITGEGGDWAWRLVDRKSPTINLLSDIRLRVEGADNLALDGGRLRLTTAIGDLSLPLLTVAGAAPASQPINPAGRLAETANPRPGTFEVSAPFSAPGPPGASAAHSSVPQGNPASLLFSTFVGGSDKDWGEALALDGAGNVVVTGYTESADFPITAGAYDAGHNGRSDVFVFKLAAGGDSLLYSTFVGGSESDLGTALALDGAGNVLVTGYTLSSDFPATPEAYDTSHNGGNYDAFVFKLAAGDAGGLLYSTFLGGSSSDIGHSLALGGEGNVVVTGVTYSSDFPTTAGAYDTSHNGGNDIFVFKQAAGGGLLFSTFVGGDSDDSGSALALDGEGNVVVTGNTYSTDFPTTPGAYDTDRGGFGVGDYDVVVFKLATGGDALLYSTFVGGDSSDSGLALALDEAGNVVVTGSTYSEDFPTTAGAYDTSFNGGVDVFVFRLAAGGDLLLYSTFVGGFSADWGYALALDGADNVLVTGKTKSSSFPTTAGAFDTSQNGDSDVFVFKLAADGAGGGGLLYGTFVGGTVSDYGNAMALDEAGNVLVTGFAGSLSFPTTAGAYDTSYNSAGEVFVFKMALEGEPDPTYSISGRVTDLNGDSLSGVTVSAGAGVDATTNANGDYAITDLITGTYTLTPSQSGYTFSPSTRTVSVPPSAAAQDFTGSSSGGETFTISGRATDADGDALSGVIVSAGAGVDATTNTHGDYAITDLITGTYTLTPSKSGYTFSPSSRTVSVPPGAAGQDFVGSYALWRVHLPLILRNSQGTSKVPGTMASCLP